MPLIMDSKFGATLSFGMSWLINAWATNLTWLKVRFVNLTFKNYPALTRIYMSCREHQEEIKKALPAWHTQKRTEKVLRLFLKSSLTFTTLWVSETRAQR